MLSTHALVEQAIDLPELAGWLVERAPEIQPPLSASMIQGGRSNLTFFVSDRAGSRWVLRRPPLGHVMATAHDVEREVRVLEALAGSLPVPGVVGLGRDGGGTPFYLMEEVPGAVLRVASDAQQLTGAGRHRAGLELVRGLARLHAVDPAEVGLGGLGKGLGYLERQIGLWQRQGDEHRQAPFPEADRVRDLLLARIPEQLEIALVHGDYRLDNVLLGGDGELRAVLDWELCTRGDPLVDLAVFLFYWTEPGDLIHPFADPPSVEPGFPDRAELLAEYVRVSGRAVPDMSYYEAYAAWRLALVFEGVLGRFVSGAYGASDPDEAARLERVIQQLVAHAQSLLAE